MSTTYNFVSNDVVRQVGVSESLTVVLNSVLQ